MTAFFWSLWNVIVLVICRKVLAMFPPKKNMSFQSCSHQQITGKNQTVVNVVKWKRYFNNSPVSVICGVYKSLSPFWYMLQAQKCKQHGRNSHKYWEFFSFILCIFCFCLPWEFQCVKSRDEKVFSALAKRSWYNHFTFTSG